ncbi:hypothetical protein FB451DRAFT_1556799 [Mycena latifolia]|nr:hypothetical protein FB451DRAFT_1556799 [Mycena latifolia]
MDRPDGPSMADEMYLVSGGGGHWSGTESAIIGHPSAGNVAFGPRSAQRSCGQRPPHLPCLPREFPNPFTSQRSVGFPTSKPISPPLLFGSACISHKAPRGDTLGNVVVRPRRLTLKQDLPPHCALRSGSSRASHEGANAQRGPLAFNEDESGRVDTDADFDTIARMAELLTADEAPSKLFKAITALSQYVTWLCWAARRGG